jgi:hypothetical protein
MKSENYVNEISVKEASAKYIAGSHITPDVPSLRLKVLALYLKKILNNMGCGLSRLSTNP